MKLTTPTKLAADAARVMDSMGDSSELLINIMLTERCCFSCAHCMMRSGPNLPATFVSEGDMLDIFEFEEQITRGSGAVMVSYNFVGGEPTLNLDALATVLRMVSRRDAQMEMTTNGWWLRSPSAFCDTVGVLRPYLADETLMVRISSSENHDAFRGSYDRHVVATHEAFVSELESEMPELRNKAVEDAVERGDVCCDSCSHACDSSTISEAQCGRCGAEVDTLDLAYSLPTVVRISNCAQTLLDAVRSCHLHVDRQSPRQLTNNGRAADNGMATKGGNCAWDESTVKFTFKPGALIHDFCCNGGPSYGGHARDGLKLLLRRTLLMQELAADYPDSDDVWPYATAAYSRCDVCPSKSAAHFSPGSVWDKLVNKALPILRRKLARLEVAA